MRSKSGVAFASAVASLLSVLFACGGSGPRPGPFPGGGPGGSGGSAERGSGLVRVKDCAAWDKEFKTRLISDAYAQMSQRMLQQLSTWNRTNVPPTPTPEDAGVWQRSPDGGVWLADPRASSRVEVGAPLGPEDALSTDLALVHNGVLLALAPGGLRATTLPLTAASVPQRLDLEGNLRGLTAGSRAVVFSELEDPRFSLNPFRCAYRQVPCEHRGPNATRISLIAVSSTEAPSVVASFTMAGRFLGATAVPHGVYVATAQDAESFWPAGVMFELPPDEVAAATSRALLTAAYGRLGDRNQKLISEMDLSRIRRFPLSIAPGQTGGPALDCTVTPFPEIGGSAGLTHVLAFSPDAPQGGNVTMTVAMAARAMSKHETALVLIEGPNSRTLGVASNDRTNVVLTALADGEPMPVSPYESSNGFRFLFAASIPGVVDAPGWVQERFGVFRVVAMRMLRTDFDVAPRYPGAQVTTFTVDNAALDADGYNPVAPPVTSSVFAAGEPVLSVHHQLPPIGATPGPLFVAGRDHLYRFEARASADPSATVAAPLRFSQLRSLGPSSLLGLGEAPDAGPTSLALFDVAAVGAARLGSVVPLAAPGDLVLSDALRDPLALTWWGDAGVVGLPLAREHAEVDAGRTRTSLIATWAAGSDGGLEASREFTLSPWLEACDGGCSADGGAPPDSGAVLDADRFANIGSPTLRRAVVVDGRWVAVSSDGAQRFPNDGGTDAELKLPW